MNFFGACFCVDNIKKFRKLRKYSTFAAKYLLMIYLPVYP